MQRTNNNQLTLADNTNVNIEIYNLLGEKISTLVNEKQRKGNHQINFGAKEIGYSSGVYFMKMNTGNKRSVFKLVEIE